MAPAIFSLPEIRPPFLHARALIGALALLTAGILTAAQVHAQDAASGATASTPAPEKEKITGGNTAGDSSSPAHGSAPAREIAETKSSPSPAARNPQEDLGRTDDRLRLLINDYRSMESRYQGAPEAGTAGLRARMLEQALPQQSGYARKDDLFSRRTGERLKISLLEHFDFAATYTLAGGAVGIFGAAALEKSERAVPGFLLGSTIFGTSAILYQTLAKPRRGDFPLMQGLQLYVPLASSYVSMFSRVSDAESHFGVTALSGLIALPLSLGAGFLFNPDPGDAQLVYSSMFWGTSLGLLFTRAATDTGTTRDYGIVGAGTLAGGLALGVLGAHLADFTYERVRYTHLGGYGGALAGMFSAWLFSDSRNEGAPLADKVGRRGFFRIVADQIENKERGNGGEKHQKHPILANVVVSFHPLSWRKCYGTNSVFVRLGRLSNGVLGAGGLSLTYNPMVSAILLELEVPMNATPLHPVVVHLPLALAMVNIVIGGLLGFAIWRKLLPLRTWTVFFVLQLLLVGGAFVAMNTGEADEEVVEASVAEQYIETHEDRAKVFTWFGVLVLVMSAVPFFVKKESMQPAVFGSILVASLILGGLGIATGKAGGELVYKHGAANAYIAGDQTVSPPANQHWDDD
ncbi:MAG: hypothetical protein GMKNLPBB_00687 [Myxococcota bacterium]|nr:hypothetical protein [Myxococcota bacterium]